MEGNKMLLKFEVNRKDRDKTSMKDGPAYYYIRKKMWETVLYIKKVASTIVFLKNHIEIWEEVITSDITEFEEVFDSMILDNHSVISLDHDYFLPVNFFLSEFKLRMTPNIVGLLLKTQNPIHRFIPTLLTFIATVMGFSTTLRLYVGGFIDKVLSKGIHVGVQ